jgi:hypothetical protein
MIFSSTPTRILRRSISLLNRRQFVAGMGASLTLPITAAMAAQNAKAEFVAAAMAELDESERKTGERLAKQGVQAMFVRASHLIPFVDLDYFYIDGVVEWEPDDPKQGPPVTVPGGFVSDLASIPQALWSVLPRTGRHAYAAVVHDYLYWVQSTKRDEADLVFKTAMQDLKVASATAEAMYLAVSYEGQSAWDSNAKLKAAGEKRILSRFPDNPLTSWSDWRKQPNVFSD